MKTLGWFKKAGLVFVKGDHTIESDGSSSKGDFNFNTDLNFNKYNHFDSSPILEFTWRENTGTKPEFRGLVDVLVGDDKNSEQFNCINASDLVWDTNPLSRVIKWRPSLNQPQQWPDSSRIDVIGQNGNDGLHYDNTAQQVESLAVNSKPIFTQAMADAGEKVKVGMEFSTATGNYVALLVNENTVVFEHEELGFVVENHIFIHPVDARTEREKAIDEMKGCCAYKGSWKSICKEFAESLYDAGYRKC